MWSRELGLDVLELKMHRTDLEQHFDAVYSAHEFGVPKEGIGFWERPRTLDWQPAVEDFAALAPHATMPSPLTPR